MNPDDAGRAAAGRRELRIVDVEPLPGQLLLPGMPAEPTAFPAEPDTLPGLELPVAEGQPVTDEALAAVADELRGLDRDGSRMAAAIRGALDMLLDGQHTGRYRWDQLHKTEKTHAGTLVERAPTWTASFRTGSAAG
jgi:hypothetical protein